MPAKVPILWEAVCIHEFKVYPLTYDVAEGSATFSITILLVSTPREIRFLTE
jgi:hypothetical protein